MMTSLSNQIAGFGKFLLCLNDPKTGNEITIAITNDEEIAEEWTRGNGTTISYYYREIISEKVVERIEDLKELRYGGDF